MKRRDFLGVGMGSAVAATSLSPWATLAALGADAAAGSDGLVSPREVKLRIKPVMTNIIHTGVWEGPCRWNAIGVEDEAKNAEKSFANWSKTLQEQGLGRPGDAELLAPAHLTFNEKFTISDEQWSRLAADSAQADAYFVYPAGSSVSAYEIAARFGKPILLKGLGCRNVDIAAYTRARGSEAFVATDEAEFQRQVKLLRARKVFRETRVLFPTDRGFPAVCSVGSIWDVRDLHQRLGVAVTTIPYRELGEHMGRTLADAAFARQAEQTADELLRKADQSFIDKRYVVRSLQFYRTIRTLMQQHACNAFTIECFEFCSSRLPHEWTITPCLIHSLQLNQGFASSCEGDLGSLLAMRLLMSVAERSCHEGNSDPREAGTFRINHSLPSLKMNGFDQPEIPYQLGRFVSRGWGTKLVVDFMNNAEKTVTVARVDPTARKLLVLKGHLVGASGWNRDLLGCSVEAVIKPPEGRCEEFLKKRLEFGNHLQWVYGDWTAELGELAQMLGLQAEVIA
ncbi:MAG: hypothetical protein GX575_12040 [Candidatus Anammoximicrobium sp.]|nr:hypothetical protein [Candidatus Anammoximicrobium sp.]